MASVTALVLTGGAAQAASPHWTLVSSPNISSPQNNALNGVSCVGASFCTAAGQYSNVTNDQTLIETRNGGTWSVVSSPNSSSIEDNFLKGVSCVSSTFCVAAGYYVGTGYEQTLIEMQNAGTWSVVSSPNGGTQNNVLTAVSCVSTKFCMATGYYNNGSTDQTLITVWNGSSWSLMSSPDSSSTQFNVLNGVSCTLISFCMATGYYNNGSTDQTLITVWNGSSWSSMNSPNGGSADFLDGVSCVSSLCTAVGQNDGKTLIEMWKGSTWSLVSSLNPSGTDLLSGVSCGSSTVCTAAGDYNNALTLIEKWSGSSWSIVSSPNTTGTLNNTLSGVSCVGSSFCMAVGYYHTDTNLERTLTERWSGTSWNVVTSANTSSTQDDELNGVSCFSSSFCMAAGDFFNGTNYQTLIEKWDGSTWSLLSSINTSPTQDNYLGKASCVGTTFCMATGRYFNGANWQTLAEEWNGGSWSLVTSPNTSSTQDNFLKGVSCFSRTFCMAAGYYLNGGVNQTLSEKWNGGSWSLVSSPNRGTQDNFLYSVTCTSTGFCMAAGFYSYASTLIEKWNGSSWSLVASPNRIANQENFLYGVSCVGTSFCMAVGTNSATLIEKWNGSSWSLVSSPNNASSGGYDELDGVNCTSTSFCMAAGYYYNMTSYTQTEIEKW